MLPRYKLGTNGEDINSDDNAEIISCKEPRLIEQGGGRTDIQPTVRRKGLGTPFSSLGDWTTFEGNLHFLILIKCQYDVDLSIETADLVGRAGLEERL